MSKSYKDNERYKDKEMGKKRKRKEPNLKKNKMYKKLYDLDDYDEDYSENSGSPYSFNQVEIENNLEDNNNE